MTRGYPESVNDQATGFLQRGWLENATEPDRFDRLIHRLGAVGLGLFIAIYVIAYSSKSIATYTSGNSLFDLAVFSQVFWNTTEGTVLYSSLEGEMSHFGRHFSPIFFLLLPFYAIYRSPETLLVLQTLALGLAAIPLYLFALRRLRSAPVALVIAGLYLANPAIHDINIVNEFHEIAFAVPLLMLAFYAADTERWVIYGVSVLGALMVKEDIALTVAGLGVYLLLFKNRRVGLLTIAASATWFIVVIEWIMPAFRGSRGPVPFPGYEYLGDGIFGIARGILTKPRELWEVSTIEPKQQYLKWLLSPVAFVSLLAPEILLIAAPALLLILASTFPPTFVIFERYAAPIVPFIYLAAVVGIERLLRLADRVVAPEQFERWREGTQFTNLYRPIVTALILIIIVSGTIYSQRQLHKYPAQLIADGTPHPHGAIAIEFTSAIPSDAVVVSEDHRWLAHAANRRDLYFLSAESPPPDYLLIDRVMDPTTNVPAEDRAQAITSLLETGQYQALRCEDGVTLYASREAIERDGAILDSYAWDHEVNANTEPGISLLGFDASRGNPDSVDLSLYWQADGVIGSDYAVNTRILSDSDLVLAELTTEPQNGTCPTSLWMSGQIIRDPISIQLPGEDLNDAAKVSVQLLDADGAPIGEPVTISIADLR